MAAQGRVRKGWLVRMSIGGIAFLGFAGWCLYDGLYRYPAIEENFQAFHSQLSRTEIHHLMTNMKSSGDTGRIEKTVDSTEYALEVSREEGTPQLVFINVADDKTYKVHAHETETEGGDPPLYVKSEWDIRTQYIMFAICLVIGGGVTIRVITAARRRLTADENAITVGGRTVEYNQIREIDKRKWHRKSIATIVYEQAGSRGKIKVDDWIYDGGSDVLKAVEEHVGSDVTIREPKEDQEAGPSNHTSTRDTSRE